MKVVSINALKKELNALEAGELVELCIRLAKYKKENKELLNYLLFEAHNEPAYIKNCKEELAEQFTTVNTTSLYLAKKTVRKILRIANKYIKYATSKQVEVELLLFFCKKLKQCNLPLQANTALHNIYQRQVEKALAAVALLHEDLQLDYQEELNSFC
jgi:hypothetical protein